MLAALRLAALLCAALVPPPAIQDDIAPAPTPAQVFEEDLAAALKHVERGRWKGAERALLRLLREHAGADYVVPHLAGIRLELQRAAFRQSCDAPDPATAVSGELVRYHPSNGRMLLRYTPDRLGDFEEHGAILRHPVTFGGPWKLTLACKGAEQAALSLLVDVGADRWYLLKLGSNVRGNRRFSRHELFRIDSGRRDMLDSALPLEVLGTQRVELVLELTPRELRFDVDGKRVFELEREESDLWVTCALGRADEAKPFAFESLELEGKVEPGWLDGRVDAALAQERERFDAAWVPPEELDAWDLGNAPAARDLSLTELFERVTFRIAFEDEAQAAAHTNCLIALAAVEPRTYWSQLHEAEQPLSASSTAYLRLLLALRLRWFSEAVTWCAELEAEPGHEADLELLRAELLLLAGRVADAERAYAAILEATPELPAVHVRRVECMLLLGRRTEATAAVRESVALLPLSPELQALQLRVEKAAKGPAWETVNEVRGEHFVLRTDAGKRVAREACDVLDEAWECCARFFAPLTAKAGPLPAELVGRSSRAHSLAYLFGGEAGYLRYVEGVAEMPFENTLGIYDPFLQQVAAWNQPSAAALRRTLRHEVAHRWLDIACERQLPRWLNEGLAQCFAACWNDADAFEPGGEDADAARTLFALAAVPRLGEWLRLDDRRFADQPAVGYALAWGAVSFLRESGALRALLDELLKGIAEGRDPMRVVDDLLANRDERRLDAAFRAWFSAKRIEALTRER